MTGCAVGRAIAVSTVGLLNAQLQFRVQNEASTHRRRQNLLALAHENLRDKT
jgi:hypothetical protein